MRSVIITSLLAVAQPVLGWGDVGHRTVGYLAQHYLTPAASSWVNTVLANEQGYDISDAATWADAVKHRRPYSSEWHYIDAQDDPPTTCGVSFNRDCSGKGSCIVAAITNHTSIVLNSAAGSTDQSEALMYLIHFIGDIHQPLHTESIDRGGNEIKVCFDNRCGRENLHGIWDTDIIHKLNGLKHTEKHNEEKEAAAKWADQLYSGNSAKGITTADGECVDLSDPEKCAMQWAIETNTYVCSYVMTNGIGWLENNDLGGDYYDGAVPIVTDRVSKAGLRLAGWINALAAASGSSFVVENGKVDL